MLKIEKLKFGAGILKGLVVTAMLGALAFVFVPYVLMNGASAEEVSITILLDNLSLSLNTDTNSNQGGDVSFPSINTTEEGSLAIARKDITVDTNAKRFELYLSSTTSEQRLCRASGSETCATAIEAVAGEDGGAVAPKRFSTSNTGGDSIYNADNSWGYAVADYSENGSETTTYGSFAGVNKYYIANTASGAYTIVSAAEESASRYWDTTWAALPAKNSGKVIHSDNTSLSYGFSSAGSAEGVIVCDGTNSATCNSEGAALFSVYYGTKVTNSLVMGEYTNTVLYTAIASLRDIGSSVPDNAYLSKYNGGAGDEVAIALNMASTSPIETDEVNVYMVNHDTYSTKIGTIADGSMINDTNLVANGYLCAVTDLEIDENGGVVVKCNVPALGTSLGTAAASATELTDANGASYDFIVSIPNYNIKFTTRFSASQLGFRYVGLQSEDANGNKYVTKMQEVTTGICNQTTGWNIGSWNITGTNTWTLSSGEGLTILRESGTYSNSLPYTTYFDGASYSVATGGATLGQFEAGDAFYGTYNENDGKYYKTVARNYDAALTSADYAELAKTDELYDDGGYVANPHATGNFSVASTGQSNYTKAAYYYWNTMTNGQRWEWDLYENRQWTLTDTRDSKEYIVRKLADGNCWMVQNLDLELRTNMTLTADDTDINTYRDPNTGNGNTVMGVIGNATDDAAAEANGYVTSWTPNSMDDDWKTAHALTGSEAAERGDYIITQRESNLDGTTNSRQEYGTNTSDATRDWKWAQNGDDGAHAYSYSAYRFVTTANSEPVIGCTGTGGSQSVSEHVISPCNTSNADYNTAVENGETIKYVVMYSSTTQTSKHCVNDLGETLVNGACKANTGNSGTWYSHLSSTAGSDYGLTTNGNVAKDSICPRGWQLPTYDTTDPKSYYNLIIRVYGGTYRANISGSLADSILLSQPLSFLRSGYYYWQAASRNARGSYGYYWESRIYSVTSAYNLNFYSSNLTPQNNSNRGSGFSVRCVAR